MAPEFIYPPSLEPQPPRSGRGARQTSIFWISVTYFGQVEIAWPVILLMPVFSCLCMGMGAASDWAVTVLILVRVGASLVGARVTLPAYCAAVRLERPMAAWLPMTAGIVAGEMIWLAAFVRVAPATLPELVWWGMLIVVASGMTVAISSLIFHGLRGVTPVSSAGGFPVRLKSDVEADG